MLNANRSATAATSSVRCHNRIAAIMAHTRRYAFRGTSRLAADVGLSKSTVSHLVHGKVSPLYSTISRAVKCLEIQIQRSLDLREVVSSDGTYPTKSICQLVGCSGCLPDKVYLDDGSLVPGLEDVKPGQWTGDVSEFRTAFEEKDGR
jgi:hypothetical protein